jgi:protein-disulfide isomerase
MTELDPSLTPDAPPVARRERLKMPQWPNYVLLVFLGLALFGAGGLTGWYLRGQQDAVATAQAEPTQQIQIPENLTRYDVPIEPDDPILGPEDAPITLIAFSDYQCPFCKRWHDQVFGRLVQEYGDRVKFIFRDFPLNSIHPQASPAAQAANCANEQGAFWQYHDALFSYKYDLGEQAFEQYARELGLDAAALMDCYNSGRYADEVDADLEFASAFGIQSTPTFFLNGIPIVGAQPYDVFKQIIDLELAGKLPKGE